MAFGERVRNRFKKSENFNYLDDLINSGKSEVKLTSDIVLDNSEELEYNEGIHIKTDGLIIDGNGFQIDAKHKVRIFTIENKNVTFKNITFKNALSQPLDDSLESIFKSMQGGALSASESKLSFKDCKFYQNAAHRGGAISLNFTECFIENCQFFGNASGDFAGAILNDELSSLTVINSEFKYNVAINNASDIYSCESSLKLIGCEFSTSRDKTSIESSSLGNLVLKNSTFNQSAIDSNSMTVIKDCTFTDSAVNVTHIGSIYCLKTQQNDIPLIYDDVCYLDGEMDWVRELTQHEFASKFLKNYTEFENGKLTLKNELHEQMGEFLEIWRKIWPHESNFVMADVIVNASAMSLEDIRENYLNQVSRKGATDKDSFDSLYAILEDVLGSVELQPITFMELDELICSNKENIRLTSDVVLDWDEIGDFEDGIKIDDDNLTIDGHGHIIDANSNAPIFKISAKNVTIKNVTFKNASAHMGGAITNIGEVTFKNCKFLNNMASELGGAIVNDEKMTICNCLFEGNSSGGVGGAIAATFASDMKITDTKFIKNNVGFDIDCPGLILPSQAQGFGGAIYNNGKLEIVNAEFGENSCDVKGGAMIVLPNSKISIESSVFKNNHAKEDGGVFHTMGEVNINDSEFRDNTADNNAGVFDATESSKLKISNSIFENNCAKNGNVIVNKGIFELAGTEIMDADIIDESK